MDTLILTPAIQAGQAQTIVDTFFAQGIVPTTRPSLDALQVGDELSRYLTDKYPNGVTAKWLSDFHTFFISGAYFTPVFPNMKPPPPHPLHVALKRAAPDIDQNTMLSDVALDGYVKSIVAFLDAKRFKKPEMWIGFPAVLRVGKAVHGRIGADKRRDFSHIIFDGLAGAQFETALYENPNLLVNADCRNSDFTGIDFRSASLAGALIGGAKLKNAKIEHVTGLTWPRARAALRAMFG